VFEAVVRYQIKSWELSANSYCVSIDGRDAPKDFLRRFEPLPVKGASRCSKRTTAKTLFSVVDKQTGKRSVIFDVETIHWITENEAEVEGGYVCATSCSAAGRYHVVHDGNQWQVTAYNISFQS